MLNEMRLRDFCCFGKVQLRLSDQGLVWVGAQNNDSEAAISNGAGKTTLFKGLTWCLFGDTIDGERGDKVIRHGTKRAIVEVDLDDDWVVRRERAKGSPKLTLLKGDELFVGDKKAVQAKIIELVGLDFKAFKNTVLYGQNDSARFADPRVSDPERKDMLHRIQRTEILKACHVIALGRVRDLKADISKMEARQAELIRVRDKAILRSKTDRERMESWDGHRDARVASTVDEARGLKASAHDLMESAPDVDALREDEASLQQDIRDALDANEAADKSRAEARRWRERVDNIKAERAEHMNNARHLREQLEQLQGDNCPLCGATLEDGVTVDELEGRLMMATDEAKRLKQELEVNFIPLVEKAEAAIKVAAEKASQAVRLERELAGVHRLIHQAESTQERATSLIEQAKKVVKRAKAIRSEVNPHKEHWEASSAEAMKASADRKRVAKRLTGRYRDRSHLEFWSRGFGSQGLPSFILDSAMPAITERANHYLDVLTDGDIQMEFSTQRELKSSKGEYRDEIDISWIIEGMEGYPPSGGQQRKMEIATDLALMDLTETREGAQINLFIADEILDGLDAEGTERVLNLLHELRIRRGSIFVISHQPAMGELFEKSITVVKTDGQSELEFAA